ncbi:M3 family metallopeptidase [Pseudomonas sp. T1.Ur]|uniref:M3 family metallopeptidase n=1 Tax=Pseudomonas sp. T1.Ur TaxID=2928704 RepID=UPI00201DF57B|nr:M3 family metallopeptidase [Pseudomonas sp. T1.Ur]MCL6704231.1 M3 family metallopeptidase [Pseudomonas sp. T1.Ur]
MSESNPLLSSYELPPFSAIRAEHLVPAVERIISDSRIKVSETIASQTLVPTWDDLVLAIDEVKARLDEIVQVIDVIDPVMTQPTWASAASRSLDLITTYKTQLAQDGELFKLYQKLAESRIAQVFDKPRQRVLQKILREFRLCGAHLPPEQQLRLARLNQDIARHANAFKEGVRQSTAAWQKHIEDESLLAGIPAPVKLRMATNARDADLSGWLVRMSETEQVLIHAQHRPLRQAVWLACQSPKSDQSLPADKPGNEAVLASLLEARYEKARLLGYENFAHLALEEQMAGSTDEVLSFLRNELAQQRSQFAQEARQLKALAAQQGIEQLEPWDYEYLAEKLREQSIQEDVDAYFPLDTVLSRLTQFCQRMFGVELLERSTFDRWHDDVRLFEAKEHGQTLGYLFIDPYRHLPGSLGQTFGLRNRRIDAESQLRRPVAVLRSPLTPGVGDKPNLLDHQQLRVLLHEFGHGLQQLLTRERNRNISGLDGLGRDADEFAGQLLEQWCFSEEFLVWMSSHYQTHEPIPADKVLRLMAALRTQTSWATANALLAMLFDFEVHRTHGDARSVQEVFRALSKEVGHLQWPREAQPYTRWEFLASDYAARIYSYKWSGVLASKAFEKIESKGVFSQDVGRSVREAFFSQGGSRSLTQSLEAFLEVPQASTEPLEAGDSPAANSPTNGPARDAPLISQLNASQQQMIRLNDAFPRAEEIAMGHLDGDFAKAFPALAQSMTVNELAVRTLREESIPASERIAGGPATRHMVTDTTSLQTLFWRTIAGQVNVSQYFHDPSLIEVVHTRDNVSQVPPALNTNHAKAHIERMLENVPRSLEEKPALDRFWENPAEFSQRHDVASWLANELRVQLRAQADFHLMDGTLSEQMHKALKDHLLAVPDAASRASMAQSVRAGVYRLHFTPEGWGSSVPFSGVVALTQHDDTQQSGGAVLYRPGSPLEIFENLTALKDSLQTSIGFPNTVDTTPMLENFLDGLVTDLRTNQKAAIRQAIQDGPGEGEETNAWLARIDAAADLGDRLDLVGILDDRELRLGQKRLNAWLQSKPYVTASDRFAWWNAVQSLHQAVGNASPLPPDPVTLATPQALKEKTRQLLARLIEEKYAPADPDPENVSLMIRRQKTDTHAPSGESPFGSGVSAGRVSSVYDDQRSLTDWAMSNLTTAERNPGHHALVGPLSFAQVVEVIETANVGARLPTDLQNEFRQQQVQWMALKEKEIRAQAWTAHISGDFRPDRANTGLNLVLAALDSPEPAGRALVNTHAVEVRQLKWGDSVLKEILLFGVKSLASRPSLTLYTPGAPDGKIFRHVDAQNIRELPVAVAQTLTATLPMTQWLISQLPLMEQARHLDSLAPAPENLTLIERIKKVTQPTFTAAKSRVQHDFAQKIASPVVAGNLFKALHEVQITHVLATTDALTVTNAERDSTDAQEGRRKAVALLTGALSMTPTARLGRVLAHLMLPVMTGGAAVSAIRDEGGSLSQWTSEFISGLGEVLAEAGQDLIMAGAARYRGKARPALSSLPRMPAPEFKPFELKNFTGAGLIPEGRDLYRDAGGQGYLKQGDRYYRTSLQGNERIVFAADNLTNQRTVVWENGRWQVQPRPRLLGGGPLMSRFRETPEQKKRNILLETLPLLGAEIATEYMIHARRKVDAMPLKLVERILDTAVREAGLGADIDTHRARLKDLKQGRSVPSHPRPEHLKQVDNAMMKVLHNIGVWQLTQERIAEFNETFPDRPLTVDQQIKIHDLLWAYRKEIHTEGVHLLLETHIFSDPFSGANFIAFTVDPSPIHNAMLRIKMDYVEMSLAVKDRLLRDFETRFPGPDSPARLDDYLAIPENKQAYDRDFITALRTEMTSRKKSGLVTEIRKNRIPFIIASRGKTSRASTITTVEDINQFDTTLKEFREPFTIEAVTQVPTKPVAGQSAAPEVPAPIEASSPRDIYTVQLSALAETQMSYDNFPDSARKKMAEIMDDIRAGRAKTKRIRRYYWFDMPQLDEHSGRGKWRAAFEREGDTWTLQGFYDYHTNRKATVWED